MKISKRIILVVVVILMIFGSIQAADSTKVKKDRQRKSLRLFYQAGSVLQTNDFVKGQNETGEPIDYFQSLSLQYGIETDGREIWQQIYGYPTWGFGLYAVNFFDKNEIGTPSAAYGFINAPFFRLNRWSLNYEVGFGLTWDWKPYDQNLNPYQYAIGSSKTVFIDVGLNDWHSYEYVITAVAAIEKSTIESYYSEIAHVTPGDYTPPEQLENFSAFYYEAGIQLIWNPSAAADLAGYNVYRRDDVSGLDQIIAVLTPVQPEYFDANVVRGRTYYYRVTAFDSSDRKNESDSTPEVAVKKQ